MNWTCLYAARFLKNSMKAHDDSETFKCKRFYIAMVIEDCLSLFDFVHSNTKNFNALRLNWFLKLINVSLYKNPTAFWVHKIQSYRNKLTIKSPKRWNNASIWRRKMVFQTHKLRFKNFNFFCFKLIYFWIFLKLFWYTNLKNNLKKLLIYFYEWKVL